jgi:tetrathionate reductase subunit B
MSRLSLLIDVARCIGCFSCVVGCENWHMTYSRSGSRRRIVDFFDGKQPQSIRWVFPVACMQCDRPPCLDACPSEAIFRDENGIIITDSDNCTGCGSCIDACPYNARYLREGFGLADACDWCADRVKAGKSPYCVESCPTSAMVFGDISDPESSISKALSSKGGILLGETLGTAPKVFYANCDELLSNGILKHIIKT